MKQPHVIHCSNGEYLCCLSRCRFLRAGRKDREDFFSFYKEDFNFQSEVIPLPDTIKSNIEEEESNDYPNVSMGGGSGG